MKIKLVQQHTHEGITYHAGAEVDLPDDVALWLISAGAERREKEVALAAQTRKVMDDLRNSVEERP